jgi:acetolactate synthase I/II/III large subunit
MNGAESLARTLVGAGVEVSFANPGTSEMHYVAALGRVQGMRSVLGLFEGVVTGAADGYARMAGKPAATLLHLGPGLANGLANIHNARRASSPMVNVVGDHATYHRRFDAPLTTDVEAVARPFSDWVRTSADPDSVARDGAAAVAAAMKPPGRIATLILPANVSWDPASGPADPLPVEARAEASPKAIGDAARALRSGEPAVLFVGGPAMGERPLALAGSISAATGARLVAQTHNARTERGVGRVAPEGLPYPVDAALKTLAGTRHMVLVGAKAPVAFFAYPGRPGALSPEDCEAHTLAAPDEDVIGALEALAGELGVSGTTPVVQDYEPPAVPRGGISVEGAAAALGVRLPEGAIVVDEALTASATFYAATRSAQQHDWLDVTGGAIGMGLPVATGAAVASPDRKVVCLQADGSAMYTLQALWTQARENLDVTTIIMNNRSYAILKWELGNVGIEDPGPTVPNLTDLDRPPLDWTSLARGMGVEADRATTMEEFDRSLTAGLRSDGPYLIDLVL